MRLSKHQGWVLFAASAANALFFFDQTSVSVSLASIQRDLGASGTEAQWVMGIYLLPPAALMVGAGKLGDLWGRRRLFVAGTVLFGLGSVLCAAAPTIELLIGGRAVQGVGAALTVPLGTAAIATVFEPERRGWAIGALATGGTTFLALGLIVGGVVSEAASWRWIFMVNMPVVVAAAVAGRSITGTRDRAAPVDWPGLALLAGGLSALVVTLIQLADAGPGSAITIAAGASAVALLAAFVLVERHVQAPLVDISLLRVAALRGSLVALAAIQFAVLGVTIYLPLYYQQELGYGAIAAGLLLLPTVLATPLFSPWTGKQSDRAGARWLVSGGLALGAAGLAALALVSGRDELAPVIPALVAFGLSRPLVITPASRAAIDAVPESQHGLASGLLTSARNIGSLLGTAVLGAVLAAIESGRRDGASAPGTGSTFEEGFTVAMLVAAGILAVTALVAARSLDHRARRSLQSRT